MLARAGNRIVTTPPGTGGGGLDFTLQRSVLSVEQAKEASLAARAERAAERRERLLDPRQRTIGVR